MIRCIKTLAALLLLSCSVLGANEHPQANRLVQVLVTRQTSDPVLPWKNQQPSTRKGYGVVVRENVILTTETLVRNNTLIEITLPGSGKKLRAREMLTDIQANLALVALIDKADALPTTPLSLADNLPMDAKAIICQTDDTSAIQTCEGTVLQICMSRVSSASYLTLSYALLTKPAVNNEGAPVFFENKLAGLTVDYQMSDREVTIIPFPVINRFMEDAREPPYSGFPTAGFMWAELVDPAKRKYFGLPEDTEQGIQVLSTIPDTGAAKMLKSNDVILSIDGAEIDSLGFYTDKNFGRLLFPYIISGHHSTGETITMSIMRDKKHLDIAVPLSSWKDSQSLIPEDYTGEMNDYIVAGGLVIRELSGRYLRAHGGDWERRVGPRLAYYYQTMRNTPEQKDDRIVVLVGALPDTINIGYQHIRNEIVTAINGEKIRNMKDLFKAVDREKGLHTISLQSLDVDLYLDPDEIEEANLRLLESYRIPAIDSRQLKSLTDRQPRP